MLTLNQIVNKLNLIQVNHAQLNSFHFGDPWELEASENLQYPVLICALLPGSLSTRNQTTRLYLAVADLVDRGESNETEVLSDTQLMLLDVYAQFNEYLDDNSILLERDAVLSPFTEKWDNAVSGWQAEVNVTQFYSRDTCQVPLKGVDVEVDETAQLTTTLDVDDSGTITLAAGSETELFRIFMVGATPASGNITVTLSALAEFWDGMQWLDNQDTITIPYVNSGITTEKIYKVRTAINASTENFSFTAGQLSYEVLIILP